MEQNVEFMDTFSPEKITEIADEKESITDDEIEAEQKKAKTRSIIPNLIHYVRDHDKVKYLVKENDELHIKEYALIEDQLYKPKQDLPIEILSPSIICNSLPNEEDVLKQLECFVKKYIEFPYEQWYLILSLWIAHTYFIEKLNVTPILNVFGVKETGKTRVGEICYLLSFRCERLTSPTEATVFRSAHYFQTTLVIDEIKLWGHDGNKGVANLIKSRYKRGMRVARTNLNRAGEDQIEYFDVFAPLAICSTETMPDIIKSRCVTFIMQRNINHNVENEIDTQEAQKIREELTLLRSKYFDLDLPTIKPVARRRLNEIMMPLVQICSIMDSSRMEELLDFIQHQELCRRDEESETIECVIVRAIHDHYALAEDSVFLTHDIRAEINKDRSQKDLCSDRYVASCINRLGFEKARAKSGPAKGRRGFHHDEDLLNKLLGNYGIEVDNRNKSDSPMLSDTCDTCDSL